MMTRQSLLLAAGIVALATGRAWAQEPEAEVSAGVEPAPYQQDPNAPPEPYGPPPIPPEAETAPVSAPGGSYCYVGPHPVDTRVEPGAAWDDTQGVHYHFYAPFDMRLFRVENDCYYFVGDPSDFGYQGQVYSYYGAHPIADEYGGGWCFMIGGHNHWWQPWSASFVVAGPWYYWNGPYDAFFWSYWPYYSYYYRAYYPHYYGGGRWFRGYERHVAPPIQRVPAGYARGWRGPSYQGSSGPVIRNVGGWRGGSSGTAPAPVRAAPHQTPGGWSGGWRGAPAPAPRPVTPAPRPAGGSGGGWRGGSVPSRPVAAPHTSMVPYHPMVAPHYSAPAAQFYAPAAHYSAPHYSAPAPHFSAPARAPSVSSGHVGGSAPSRGGGWHR
jgi:hypothetical protein